jgi:hypothetical protein
MDMFNAKDRRHPSMDDHMNLKKPGFGGPSSKEDFDKSKRTTLKGYQRVIDRNSDFEGGKFNHNYDTTWKAVTRDLISRSANKKPFDPMYAKPTIASTEAVEEGRIFRFEEFISENFNMFSEAEEENPFMSGEESSEETESEEIQVDEEKLEALIEDYGDELKDLVEDIAEKMEIEKEEAFDLLCAAIKKMKDAPEEEESDEEKEEEAKEEESEEEGA